MASGSGAVVWLRCTVFFPFSPARRLCQAGLFFWAWLRRSPFQRRCVSVRWSDDQGVSAGSRSNSPSVPYSGWKIAFGGVIGPRRANPGDLLQLFRRAPQVVQSPVADHEVGEIVPLNRAGGAAQYLGEFVLEASGIQPQLLAQLGFTFRR